MQFWNAAVTLMRTIVIALGAGLLAWGGINLMEGYGGDNPGAKSQGIKQIVAGGGVLGAVAGLEDDLDPRVARKCERIGQEIAEIVFHPRSEEVVRRSQHDLSFINGDRDQLLEPLLVRGLGLGSDVSADRLPYLGGVPFSVRHFCLSSFVLFVSVATLFSDLLTMPPEAL